MTPARGMEDVPLPRSRLLVHECLAEALGAFVLVFFGTGAVFVAVLLGGLAGLFQVAIVWGVAIALAIYATSAVSGTHINPAVTLAVATFRGFPRRKVLPYIAAQVFGAFLAAAVLFGLFHGILAGFEAKRGLVRGQPGSELSAMVFGEYFPNPDMLGTTADAFAKVSITQAMVAEGLGTAALVFFVFALTDSRQLFEKPDDLLAAFVLAIE